jgi:hypothetical protein
VTKREGLAVPDTSASIFYFIFGFATICPFCLVIQCAGLSLQIRAMAALVSSRRLAARPQRPTVAQIVAIVMFGEAVG